MDVSLLFYAGVNRTGNRSAAVMLAMMSEPHPGIDYVTPSEPVPAASVAATLTDGTKVKVRIPRMRACDEKNEKGKLCHGHLKRWYSLGAEVAQKFGKDAEIYRCEHCKTLYLPNPHEKARSGTLAY